MGFWSSGFLLFFKKSSPPPFHFYPLLLSPSSPLRRWTISFLLQPLTSFAGGEGGVSLHPFQLPPSPVHLLAAFFEGAEGWGLEFWGWKSTNPFLLSSLLVLNGMGSLSLFFSLSFGDSFCLAASKRKQGGGNEQATILPHFPLICSCYIPIYLMEQRMSLTFLPC